MDKKNSKTAICFVADFKYLFKNFKRIHTQLVNNGKFKGDVIIITSLLSPTFLISIIRKNKNVQVLRFKKIRFSKQAENILSNLNTNPNRHNTKRFQWQKLNVFHTALKKWVFIFYLDINMIIHHDINLILNKLPINKIYARCDGYPDYKRILESQFEKNNEKFKELSQNFDLSINNYFQTGVLYFDTSIIKKNTLRDLIELVNKFPISITNEQGILNLYFIFIKNIYQELPVKVEGGITYQYWNSNTEKIIITKSNKEQFK